MLVSCITPTADRRDFWPRCIERFRAQDYPELEWVIMDNGARPIEDLLPLNDPRIRYHTSTGPKLTHGRLMNACMEVAKGEIAIVWDDDDFYSPDRVSKQVQPLLDNPNIDVCGTGKLYYYLHGRKRAFLYRNLTSIPWLAAPAFRRSVWERHGFADMRQGADTRLLANVPKERWKDLDDPGIIIAAIHPGNAAPKRLSNPAMTEVPWSTIEEIAKGMI
jgi:glycosyltransferase involved in cell wall biosynthesis